MTPKYIVIHTAGFKGVECDAAMIDSWHKQRGWAGIGYHFVILNDKHTSKADGTLEYGRAKDVQGAHARGINSQSLGICCVGHGDVQDFTANQYQTLYQLLSELIQEFSISVDHIIGHRELNKLVNAGIVSSQYHTDKSCPGRLIDMDAIREKMSQLSPQLKPNYTKQELLQALTVLEHSQQQFSLAGTELKEFLTHPEVIELRAK